MAKWRVLAREIIRGLAKPRVFKHADVKELAKALAHEMNEIPGPSR
jgi:hypothetical protein